MLSLYLHPEWPTSSLTFTMELPVDDKIPFIRIEIIKNGKNLETQVKRKSTITGFLLLSYSRTGKHYTEPLFVKDNATSHLCSIFQNKGIAERNADIVKVSQPFKYQVSAIIQFVGSCVIFIVRRMTLLCYKFS